MTPEYRQELRNAIELYQSLGFSIIPLGKDKKPPEGWEWKEFQTRKMNDTEIELNFFGEEDVNVGIVCGTVSNLGVIDFDDIGAYYKAFPNWKELEKNTIVVESSPEKRHVYYRTEGDCPTKKRLDLKVEFHGDGTYVMAPPSIHPKGHQYKFIGEVRTPLFEKDPKERIKNIFDKVEGKAPVSCYLPPCFLYVFQNGVTEGERDESAIRIASYLKTHRTKNANITAFLTEWNKRNKPPLNESIISQKVSSAEKGYKFSCESFKSINSFFKGCDEKNCKYSRLGIEVIAEDTENVLKIPPDVTGDPWQYQITIKGKEFLIRSDFMLTPRVFKRMWFETFDNFLRITQKDWEEIMDIWGEKVGIGETDMVSDENFVAEEVLRRISLCGVTDVKEEVINNERYILQEVNSDPILLYPSQHIKKIVDMCGIKISLKRLSDVLQPYIAEKSKQIRVGNSINRFWVFKNSVLNKSEAETTLEGEKNGDSETLK